MSSRKVRIGLGALWGLILAGCAAAMSPHGSGPVSRQQMLEARVTELRYQIQENGQKLGLTRSDSAAFAPSRHGGDAGMPAPAPVRTGPKAGRCTQVCDLADAICQDAEELCKIADELADPDSHAQCQDAQQSCHQAQQRCQNCK